MWRENEPTSFYISIEGGYIAVHNIFRLNWILRIMSQLEMVGSEFLFWTLKQERVLFLE